MKRKKYTTKKIAVFLHRTLPLLQLVLCFLCVSIPSRGMASCVLPAAERAGAMASVLDTICPVWPDSTIRQRAKALGMVDTAVVNPKLRQLEFLEKNILPKVDTTNFFRNNPKYLHHHARALKGWIRLIPNQFTIQYAGSIGLANLGLGWNYGRGKHWETDLLVGFLPRYYTEHAHATFTIKQRYVPWHCRLSSRWTLQPLTAGLFFNTISGDDFWRNEPDRYPKRYYGFSTKVRSNVFLGQRIRYRIPSRHRLFHTAVSAYYEVSSCDLYIVSKAVNKDYPWSRTLSLAFGLRWEM